MGGRRPPCCARTRPGAPQRHVPAQRRDRGQSPAGPVEREAGRRPRRRVQRPHRARRRRQGRLHGQPRAELFFKGYYHHWDSAWSERHNTAGSGQAQVISNEEFWGFKDDGEHRARAERRLHRRGSVRPSLRRSQPPSPPQPAAGKSPGRGVHDAARARIPGRRLDAVSRAQPGHAAHGCAAGCTRDCTASISRCCISRARSGTLS